MEEGSKSLGSLVGCDGVSRVRWARLPPVEAGAVGEHGRPRLAGRSAVRAVVGPPRASGIGHRGGPRALPLPRGRNRPDSLASCYRRFEVLRGRILGRAFRGRGS